MTYCIDGEQGIGNITAYDIPDNHAANGDIIRGVVGDDVEFGQVVYLSNDEKWYKGCAVFGKCPVHGMIIDQIQHYQESRILLRGFARNDSWQFGIDVGSNLYLDTNVAGELSGVDPGNEYNQIIGTLFLSRQNSTKIVIYFNPR